MVSKMRSAAGLFYAAVFGFMGVADAESHGTKTTDMVNKCAVSESRSSGSPRWQRCND